MTLLNLAEICPITRTLGPGQRFALWVQGCCFNCDDCIAPEWIPQQQAFMVEPKVLAQTILSVPGTAGVTISGGEPMLQAAALSELLTELRREKDLSIICFTGFTLAQLLAKSDQNIQRFLSQLDVLIDGQYVAELNDNQGWRGSANQVVHFLTDRHLAEADLFRTCPRNVEIHLRDDAALMVGIPPHNFSQNFRQAIDVATAKTLAEP